MSTAPTAPIIYTLFPRLAGPMDRWVGHARRVRDLGFTCIHLNPFQYAGFSGSIYAIKDFYRVDPLLIPDGVDDPLEELRRTIAAMHEAGVLVVMDLIINHTSKDCPLIKNHPEWFRRDRDGYVVSPSAIDPADAREVTVWGDLAEVDNANSSARQELWAYWTALVQFYLDIGFDGFRCDAAYKVPVQLWEQLINAGRQRTPRALFLAETLGCRLSEVRSLQPAGFDLLFNSSKWWRFDAEWALEQHAEFADIAPSISFPESHDTPRLMEETGGLLQVQRQRYAFAAAFSRGLLVPIGYEYAFRRPLDVVETRSEHWEDTGHDLGPFIRTVNQLKQQIPAMRAEGRWDVLTDLHSPTTVLRKRIDDGPPLVLAINKDWHAPQSVALPDAVEASVPRASALRVFAEKPGRQPLPSDRTLVLAPAEVVYITPA